MNFARQYSEDEAQQAYETIVCLSIRGLELFLRLYFSNLSKNASSSSPSSSAAASSDTCLYTQEKFVRLFANDSKLWKLGKDASSLKVGWST